MIAKIDKGMEILYAIKDIGFSLQQAFIKKFHQDWGLKESAAELVIQIGHLTQALIENNKIPTNKNSWQESNRNSISNIPDELSDCMLSICSICGFANITEDEVKKCPCTDITDGNYSKLVIELNILSAQLLDSAEIFIGLKPKFDRNEKMLIVSAWKNILYILTYFIEDLQIDIVTNFKNMDQDARKFLSECKEKR